MKKQKKIKALSCLLLIASSLSMGEHSDESTGGKRPKSSNGEVHEINPTATNENQSLVGGSQDFRWSCKDDKVIRETDQKLESENPSEEQKAKELETWKEKLADLISEDSLTEEDVFKLLDKRLIHAHGMNHKEKKEFLLSLQLNKCVQNPSPVCYYYAEHLLHHLGNKKPSPSQSCRIAKAFLDTAPERVKEFLENCKDEKAKNDISQKLKESKQTPSIQALLALAFSKDEEQKQRYLRLVLLMPDDIKKKIREQIKAQYQVEFTDCELLRFSQTKQPKVKSLITHLAPLGIVSPREIRALGDLGLEQENALVLRLNNSPDSIRLANLFQEPSKKKYTRIQELLSQLPNQDTKLIEENIDFPESQSDNRALFHPPKDAAAILAVIGSKQWTCHPEPQTPRNVVKKELSTNKSLFEQWNKDFGASHEESLKKRARNAITQFQENKLTQLDLILILDDLQSQSLEQSSVIKTLALEFAPSDIKEALKTVYEGDSRQLDSKPLFELAFSQIPKHEQLYRQLITQIPYNKLPQHLQLPGECLMNHPDPSTIEEFDSALKFLNDKNKLPFMLRVIRNAKNNNTPEMRVKAINHLATEKEQAHAAVPDLIKALKDQESLVRSSAAQALGRMGEKARDVVPALIGTLKDEDMWVQIKAIEALGAIGPKAKPALVELETLLNNSPDKEVRAVTTSAIKKIKNELGNH